MDRYDSLNHNIYIAADPTPVDIAMRHMRAIPYCAHNVYWANRDDPPTLNQSRLNLSWVYISTIFLLNEPFFLNEPCFGELRYR